MSEILEGNGYLFHGNHLVASVRYRLRPFGDEWGRSVVEGEVQPRSRQKVGKQGDRYMLHTEAGFSVPLELQGAAKPSGWLPIRRTARERMAHAVG